MKHVYKYLLMLVLALSLCALWGCGEKTPAQQPDDDQQQQQPSNPEGDETEQSAPLSDVIECSNGDTTLRFIRSEDGNWAWKDDRDFPLDNAYARQLLHSVEEMLTAQPITTDKSVKDLGLDEEDKYVTASNELGEQITWYLGDRDEAGHYYMRRADDETNAVYLSPVDLHAQISRSIYDMMLLPELTAIPLESIRSVVITRGEQQLEMRPSSQGVLTGGTADVQPLLDLLAQPKLHSCFNFRPSKGAAAICGLDPADAVLTVEYVNALQAESTFTLTIGDMRGEGYCVYVNDDTTIYLMDAAAVEAVLAFVPQE